MAIRRKAGVRAGIRRRMPASITRQELLKNNLKRFQEMATRLPKVADPSPAQPKSPPAEKAKTAPVGEILPPERDAFNPGARMMEANRHVQRSVREASLIIRDSEVFLVGAKKSMSVSTEPGMEQAADMVKKAERSVAEALELVLGPDFMKTESNRKTSATSPAPVVEGAHQPQSQWTGATPAGSAL